MKGTVSVIGPNADQCSPRLYSAGQDLGELLADTGLRIVNGGLGGFMEAVHRGAQRSASYSHGMCIGILPSENKADANAWCDTPIPTGIGAARNRIVVNSGDVVVAAGGGAGTLSELAFAWQLGKPIICLSAHGGWAANLAGKAVDQRERPRIMEAQTVSKVQQYLNTLF